MTVIAVTGASGFVGRHFCEAARLAGVTVRPVRRTPHGPADIEQSLQGVDTVVHLAARVHRRADVAVESQAAFRKDNVELTGQVAAACRAMGVARLVFVSSAGVLGKFSPPGGFDDTSLPAPHDAYTRSKLSAEELLKQRFADGVEIVIIRPPLVYGPGAAGSFARIAKLATSGWPLPLGAMNSPRSMISVRNLSDLLLKATRAPDAAGLCMLAADAELTSVAELVRSIAAAAGRKARLVNAPPSAVAMGLRLLGRASEYPSLAMPFVLRGSVAIERLGWAPPYRQADELRWTVTARFPAAG